MVDGDDIPDVAEGRPPQQVRTQQPATTRPTDRPLVDFEERRNILNEVRNITNNENRTNMANVHPDQPDNHSSSSSDVELVGHWDNNWAEQKCNACGKRGHTSRTCEKTSETNSTAANVIEILTQMLHVMHAGQVHQDSPTTSTRLHRPPTILRCPQRSQTSQLDHPHHLRTQVT